MLPAVKEAYTRGYAMIPFDIDELAQQRFRRPSLYAVGRELKKTFQKYRRNTTVR